MKSLLKNYKLVIVLILIAPLVSCSSDDDNVSESSRVKDLLTNKWFHIQNEDTTTTPSTFNVFDACEQNSYFTFYEDGTLVAQYFDTDNDICDANQAVSVTYALMSDDETLIFYYLNADPTVLLIDSITENEFILIETGSTTKLHLQR